MGVGKNMERGLADYAMKSIEVGGRGYLRPTQAEILREKKRALEVELKAVDEALEALEKNPEIERILGLIQRAI